MLDCTIVHKEVDWVDERNAMLVHCETQTDSTKNNEKYLHGDVGAIQRFVFFVMNHSREEEQDGAR
jgi:hypothetical protein